MLFFRALLSFLVLPGMVGGVVPFFIATYDPWKISGWPPAICILVLGLFILGWTVRDFYVAGKGTLAPWDPPKELVIVGLFKYLRNPMYVGVLSVILGWGLYSGSLLVDAYACVFSVIFHIRVIVHEEPWCHRQFGQAWEDYSSTVNRWLPGSRNPRQD